MQWLSTLGWMAGLAFGFGVLARLMPCNPGMYWWKNPRAVATDLVYWLLVPLFLNLCQAFLLIAAVQWLFSGRAPDFLSVGGLPLWLQCLLVLVVQDVLLYWVHRAFHGRLGWKFHAVHHSPRILDWMSTARFHPLNNLLAFTLANVVVLLLGFREEALLVLTPFNIIYSAMVHANLNWTFGPLKYVFASPVFHRWHHTTEKEGLDKNFASTFPVLDLLFGTFYMPPGKLPEQFGDADFPETFWGQFFYPLGKLAPSTPAAPRAARLGRAVVVTTLSALVVIGLLHANALLTSPARQNEPEQPAAVQRPTGFSSALVQGPAPCQPLGLELPQPTAVLAVALSRDGRFIVSGGQDGKVKVWDTATREERIAFTGHSRAVRSVAVSGDGKRIVSGGYDRTVTVWDVEAHRELWTQGVGSGVLGVAISGDGSQVVSSGADGTIAVWDGRTGQRKRVLPGQGGAVTSVALGSDGRLLVSAGGLAVKTYDPATGRTLRGMTGHKDLVYAAALSPDGKRIVSASIDQTLKVWNAATGELEATLAGHRGPVYAVALTDDGSHLVSGGLDHTVRVWDVATGQASHVLEGHGDSVMSVAVSADGRLIVSASLDGTLKVWNLQTRNEPPRQTARSEAGE